MNQNQNVIADRGSGTGAFEHPLSGDTKIG